ncbi:MAG: helix-turn-helix domain-containing protein [Minicystis sp.]
MTAPRKKRTPRADSARNREQLLAAAEAELAEHGLEASVADIARRAGVAKATFFRHFATKDDLIVAIVEPHLAELEEAARSGLEAPDPGEALLAFLTVAAVQRSARDISFMLRKGSAPTRVLELRDRLFASIVRLVDHARASGAIRKDVTGMDVFLLMCAPIHVVEQVSDPEPELWRRYLGILFDGLRPEGAHPLPLPPPKTL